MLPRYKRLRDYCFRPISLRDLKSEASGLGWASDLGNNCNESTKGTHKTGKWRQVDQRGKTKILNPDLGTNLGKRTLLYSDEVSGCRPKQWGRPSEGFYKVNTDAAIRENCNQVGMCIVICDYEGGMVGSSTQILVANFSPLVAEATALFRGNVFTVEAGLLPVVAESDSNTVLKLINGGNSPLAEVGIIISNPIQLIRHHCITVGFVPRSLNMIARILAKLSLFSICGVVGFGRLAGLVCLLCVCALFL
ncbi:hypothetical protein Dsin_029751 [Dipteronia sinensis]|uniref:RNase H type-1 domain-containing protein n=1 Tax=Dipteronia sinensis TaxID=43782 RepID=A0AAD9ZTM8_9ROSI|nr:hypothetical protein Dsin_029751 [Dipteronia sinensis]